jgi:multiple sugar transport system permease protein
VTLSVSGTVPTAVPETTRPKRRGSLGHRSLRWRIVSPIVATIMVLVAVVPILWVILVSFMPKTLQQASTPHLIFTPTLANYVSAFQLGNGRFVTFLTNSVIVTLVSTAVSLVMSIFGAYGLARLRPPGHAQLGVLILFSRLLPPVALVVPLYLIEVHTHLLDTRIGLILPYIALGAPLATWFLQGFFMDMPKELEEAARVDGCNRFMAFVRVVLPLAGPGIAAASVFCFTLAWNDMVLSLALTRINAVTLPALIAQTRGDQGVDYGQLGALTLFVLVPVTVFSLFVQRWIVGGLTGGSTKG